MELMEYTKTYQEYKKELDAVLTRTAEDFVQIGYLLKVARDTNVLAESGYATVTDFRRMASLIICSRATRDLDMQSLP